jgi:prepilin-type N-terminal cleavage/methylation domain-containing protein
MLSVRPGPSRIACPARPHAGGEGRLRRSGFTLIELLTVMAISAVLLSLSFGLVQAGKQRAAVGRARSELAALTQALEDFKRHYGDYPQTGNAQQASPVVSANIGNGQAQALLLNALIGVYGPSNFSTRINGPLLIEISKFTLEVPLTTATATTFGVAQGTPPSKQVVANALLDPWGNRYMYYYRAAGAAGSQWRAPAYVLYSVGPDGAHTAPSVASGLFTGTTQTTGNNADNIYVLP